MNDYSPQIIENLASKWLPLATTAMDGGSAGFAGVTNRSVPILGQPPGSSSKSRSHIDTVDLESLLCRFFLLHCNRFGDMHCGILESAFVSIKMTATAVPLVPDVGLFPDTGSNILVFVEPIWCLGNT